MKRYRLPESNVGVNPLVLILSLVIVLCGCIVNGKIETAWFWLYLLSQVIAVIIFAFCTYGICSGYYIKNEYLVINPVNLFRQKLKISDIKGVCITPDRFNGEDGILRKNNTWVCILNKPTCLRIIRSCRKEIDRKINPESLYEINIENKDIKHFFNLYKGNVYIAKEYYLKNKEFIDKKLEDNNVAKERLVYC